MGLRLTVCLIVFAFVLSMDWKRMRHSSIKARTIYILLLIYAVYSAVGFVAINPLPNLNDGVSLLFRQPAGVIDTALKAPPT